MTRVRPYYAERSLSAEFYDVVTAADTTLEGDIAFYAGLAPAGGSVLELGVGGGRIAFALAEQGFSVAGVDLAPAMLDKAKARLAKAPPEIAERLEFRLGDLTAVDLARTFDLVICPFYTLSHVPAGAGWRDAFTVMARHLAPGGAAAVHLPMVELMRLPGPADPDTIVLDQPLPTGGRLHLHIRERHFDEETGCMDQVIDYVERDATWRVRRRSLERMTYYAGDPAPPAAAAGLVPARPPTRLGGVGDIFVFRKP